ncbi:MAG: hypothetical protein ACR2M7_00290 [Bdellovibrionales bacterium]
MRLFLVFFVCFLSGCQRFNNLDLVDSFFSSFIKKDLAQASLEKEFINETYLLLHDSQEKIKLEEFNRSRSGLSLLDKIFLPKASDLTEESLEDGKDIDFQKVDPEKFFKVKISSICNSLTSDYKAVEVYYSFKNKYEYSFLNIIPKEVLLSSEEKAFSCSFIFAVRKDDRLDHYMVTQQSIFSSPEEIGLVLKNTATDKLNNYSLIGSVEEAYISIVKKDTQLSDDYLFICNGFIEKGIPLEGKDFENSFFFHKISEKNLPKGIQNCRIVSETAQFAYGMTQLFRVDFDQIYSTKKVLDLSTVNYEVIREGNPFLTLTRQGFGYKHDIRKYETAYPFSVVRFTGLPKDFSSDNYKEVQVKVDSRCSSDLAKNVIENNYQFMLTEEFSLMSVTPAWFFQLHYEEKERQYHLKHASAIKNHYTDLKNKLSNKKNIDCVYGISLESYNFKGKKKSLNFPKTNHFIKWSSGSYGVNLSSHVSQESVFIKDLKPQTHTFKFNSARAHLSLERIFKEEGGYFNLVFLNQLSYRNSSNLYPDKMTLRCDSEKNELGQDFKLDFFSLDRLGSSIPLSLIFSHPSIIDYINESIAVKCRLLFYKDTVLKYFSSEITVFS